MINNETDQTIDLNCVETTSNTVRLVHPSVPVYMEYLFQCTVKPEGLPYKGIVWSPKREKSLGFFCGQRYPWTKVLRFGLLARAYALIFRNQNQAYTITIANQQKRTDEDTDDDIPALDQSF